MATLMRRTLKFDSFPAVIADAETLLRGGYDTTGKWDLAQVAGHLAAWLSFGMDGFPKAPLPVRMILWALRNTVAKGQLRKVLATKTFPPGGPTVKESVPAEGGDEAAAVETLRAAYARAEAFTGELVPSPVFGRLTRDEWVSLNLVHAAHHLSFLTPKSS